MNAQTLRIHGWTAEKAAERRDNSLRFAREVKEAKQGAWKTYLMLFVELAHKYHRYFLTLRRSVISHTTEPSNIATL